jgi:hypothetical protein
MTDYTAEIAAAMSRGMDGENRRRELASQMPGHGALVQLPEVTSGPGVGLTDVPLPTIGESHQAAPQVPQHKAYGPPSPMYADPFVAGPGYPADTQQPALRSVMDIGDGRLLVEGRSVPAADAFAVVSPPARPSLLSRLLGRLRRH